MVSTAGESTNDIPRRQWTPCDNFRSSAIELSDLLLLESNTHVSRYPFDLQLIDSSLLHDRKYLTLGKEEDAGGKHPRLLITLKRDTI